jgi:hypothetical protein|mmetsp:Transcript_1197/g.2036  ORF Transcript_1197/g.2036 Transcript_1197/m.2036 type:complete len:624 (-) Transcript_1197:126-1997(-)
MPTRDAPQPFKMRVYFPKYVTVNNKPLFLLFWLVWFVTIGIAVYQFIAGKRYEIRKLPEGEVSLCSQFCPASTTAPTGQTGGTTFGSFAYASFCTAVQGTASAEAETCVSAGDAKQYGPSTLFIPTFFEDTKMMNPTYTSADAGCSTSTGYAANSAESGPICRKDAKKWVPGVEQQSIEFSHRYIVQQPTSSIFGDQPDIYGNSLLDTTTVVLDRDGQKQKEFSSGQRISFTVAELLELAGLHECCDTEVGGALDLDASYTRADGGVVTAKTARETGVSLVIDILYTNEGGCRLDLQHDTISLDGTAACMSVRARRQWTRATSRGHGATTSSGWAEYQQFQRQYSGIEISFHIHGAFKFIDASAFFRGMTTILIWMGIPIWIMYFFAILFLGNLSAIYSRVIHQELSLSGACVGLAGRLISHTSAFADVQDFPEGLSKKRLHERFQMIMQFSQDLDDQEVRKFVDFVYEGVAIAATEAEVGTDNELIDVQDFCTVCSTNESLTFDSLVKIFDRDRRLGTFESFFQDNVIEQARSIAANDTMSEAVKNALVKQAGGRHGDTFSRGAGAFNAVMLEQRFQEVEEQINKIQTEMNKTLLKEKNIVKQVEFAEKNVERLGGTLQYGS